MDDTRGCCKFCGADLEPGQICASCLALGLNPANYDFKDETLRSRRAGAAFLLDIHSHREMMINKQSWGIGRHLSNELVIEDPYISRFHARITFEQEHYYVEDLGSTNGTYFNEDILSSRRRIRHGDRLQIGKSEFIFIVPVKAQALGG